MIREDLKTVRAILARKRQVKAFLEENAGHCRPGLWYVEGPYARHSGTDLPDSLRDSIRGVRRRRGVRELVERMAPPWQAIVPEDDCQHQSSCSIAYLSNGGKWKLFDLENQAIWTRSIFVDAIQDELEKLRFFGRYFNIPAWRTLQEDQTLWRFEQYIPGPSLASCVASERMEVLRRLAGQFRDFALHNRSEPDARLTVTALQTLQRCAPRSVPARIAQRLDAELQALAASACLIPTHGDLSGQNVFLADGTAWVIDWDNAGVRQPGAYDLLYLILREAVLGRTDLLERFLTGELDGAFHPLLSALDIPVASCGKLALLVHGYIMHFHRISEAGKRDATSTNVNDWWDPLHDYCRPYL